MGAKTITLTRPVRSVPMQPPDSAPSHLLGSRQSARWCWRHAASAGFPGTNGTEMLRGRLHLLRPSPVLFHVFDNGLFRLNSANGSRSARTRAVASQSHSIDMISSKIVFAPLSQHLPTSRIRAKKFRAGLISNGHGKVVMPIGLRLNSVDAVPIPSYNSSIFSARERADRFFFRPVKYVCANPPRHCVKSSSLTTVLAIDSSATSSSAGVFAE